MSNPSLKPESRPSPEPVHSRPAGVPASTVSPLDSLWQGRVVIWVVLAAEGLAAVLTLAGDAPLGRWIRFGLLSLTVQWVALLTLGGLYLLRKRLDDVKPQIVQRLSQQKIANFQQKLKTKAKTDYKFAN